MSEENTQEEKKPNTAIRIVNTVLCVCIILSVVINIYEFNINNTLKNEIHIMETDIEALQNERDTHDAKLTSEKESLSDLLTQIEELENTIDNLEADNKSLSDSLQELSENEYKGNDESDTNLELDDELKAIADEVYAQMLLEHPEWAVSDSTGTITQNPNYVHVDGTPSTGELPTFNFDPNDTDGLSTDVTVY